ncbi:MAG: ABC transporter ATP-binding protein [Gammaproteobacteria bacterium]
MTERIVEARGLTRSFGDTLAVDSLDLSIEKGIIYGFLGPNGCGKTTSMRMMTGLLTPTAGEVEVLGTRLPGNAEKLKRLIGYMTQVFSLYGDLTVRENLQFVARIYGIGARACRQRIDELLAVHDLNRFSEQRAGSMSGGERQRLALAAATLHRPKLLFLDEPTAAVDPETRRQFWEQLFDLVDDGATILVSTHYMDEAERCHRLAILENGVKRADGTPRQLMQEMGVNVVEIEGTGLRTLRKELISLPEVVSAAQLGARLRVLVSDSVAEPDQWLRMHSLLNDAREIRRARPSLEDVFVTSTGRHRE